MYGINTDDEEEEGEEEEEEVEENDGNVLLKRISDKCSVIANSSL